MSIRPVPACTYPRKCGNTLICAACKAAAQMPCREKTCSEIIKCLPCAARQRQKNVITGTQGYLPNGFPSHQPPKDFHDGLNDKGSDPFHEEPEWLKAERAMELTDRGLAFKP